MIAALPTTGGTVLTGFAGLVVAMGIGCFALTPLLPLLQANGLTLLQGVWLADANYLGYVLGALACLALNPTPSCAARGGLAAVSLFTLGMALSPPFLCGLLLRLAAGVASAFVLVGILAWVLGAMVGPRRSEHAGAVYAGIGILTAGLAALAVGLAGQTATAGWGLVGGIAAAVTAGTWPNLRSAGSPPSAVGKQHPTRSRLALVACYGAFGLATFCRPLFFPPWPANSSLIRSGGVRLNLADLRRGRRFVNLGVRRLAAPHLAANPVGLQLVMAVGVLPAAAPRLIAAMTAAFGTGQLIGPLLVGSGAGVRWALAAAALLLLLSLTALLMRDPAAPPRTPPERSRIQPDKWSSA